MRERPSSFSYTSASKFSISNASRSTAANSFISTDFLLKPMALIMGGEVEIEMSRTTERTGGTTGAQKLQITFYDRVCVIRKGGYWFRRSPMR